MPPATAAAGDAANSGSAVRVDEAPRAQPPTKRRRYCAHDWLDWVSFADFEGRRRRRRRVCCRQVPPPPSAATAVRYGELHAVGSGPGLYSVVEQLKRELSAAAATDGWQRADALLSGPAGRTFAFEDSPGAWPDAYPLIVGRVIASESGLSRAAGLGRYIEQLLAAAEASVLYYGGSLQYLVCHESQHSGAPRRHTGGRTEEQRLPTVVLCGPFWLRRRSGEDDDTNVPPPLLWALACIAMGGRVIHAPLSDGIFH
jgi:hypothetical protein